MESSPSAVGQYGTLLPPERHAVSNLQAMDYGFPVEDVPDLGAFRVFWLENWRVLAVLEQNGSFPASESYRLELPEAGMALFKSIMGPGILFLPAGVAWRLPLPSI